MMTTQLHQMNVSYFPVEDRLLLKISSRNEDEYRLWLTRRYAQLLLKILDAEMDKIGGKHTVASNDQTRKMYKDGAFEKAYEEENRSYPLGEKGILAFRVNTAHTEDGNLQLELSPEKGQGISLNLNHSLIYMLNNLISQGIAQAQWNLQTDDAGSSKVH